MKLCKHEIEAAWCSIELHGVTYDPWGTNFLGATIYDWNEPTPDYYPSSNPAPSQRDWDRAELAQQEREDWCSACIYLREDEAIVYDDHTCQRAVEARRPLATQILPRVAHPEGWEHEYEFSGTRFLGFYRDDVSNMSGFSYDENFAQVLEGGE